ncbi:DUF6083 domain-containing protein [Streptomyces sp. TG1A-8]|nr:DUF6083 domain-containing protein [Streptomyces sp. TG1A-8]MDO0929740.1 DUF6083 domain-containing protein [Streptomyces sp. TG1A-8]
MRVHQSSPSTLLRRDAIAQCRYCGERMEYFDRYDHGRIPMVPKALPSDRFPVQMRWHILRGIALPGDGGESYCYVPHPAFCAAVEHPESSRELTEVRALFRLRFEKRIKQGFIPVLRPSDEDEVAEQHVEPVEGLRHVIAYASALWLAPGKVEDIQCVARAWRTGERCLNAVSHDEGEWTEIEIPYTPGRAGQEVLWAGSTMWVYALHTLYPDEFRRWMHQHCTQHTGGTSKDDALPPQWVRFRPLVHDDFILRERPAQVELPSLANIGIARLALEPERTECATPDCHNGSVAKVLEGWLCYKCERARKHRERVHRQWVKPDN